MTVQKIIYTDSGVANVFRDGTIELHKDLQLPQFSLLREKILDHEMDHDFKRGFWYNLKVDVLHTVSTYGLLRFMISRPKTWTQLMPVYWSRNRGVVYDKNIMLFWGIIFVAILMLTFTLIKFYGGI